MSDTPENDNPKPKYKLDKYEDRIKVEANEFYEDRGAFKEGKILERKMSANMKRIYNIVSTTAIDRLNEKKFIEFYNDKELHEFHGARLTRIYAPDTGLDVDNIKNDEKAIGFLFASFYSRTEEIITDGNSNKKTIYIGMAFPGIKFEERTKEQGRAEWNRQDFYKMFLGFYLDQIFTVLKREIGDANYNNSFIQELEDRIDNYDITDPTKGNPADLKYKEDVRNVIRYLHEEKVKIDGLASPIPIPRMQIEAYAENPITYNDFCRFDFNYNVKPPSDEFELMSKNWSVADLLHYSYVESNNPNPPVFLEPVKFAVNLTPLEWRTYFEIAINKNIVPMKYYLWQNYNFPNKAFKVTIPLNAENFWKVVKGVNQKNPGGSSAFDEDFDNEIKKLLNKTKENS